MKSDKEILERWQTASYEPKITYKDELTFAYSQLDNLLLVVLNTGDNSDEEAENVIKEFYDTIDDYKKQWRAMDQETKETLFQEALETAGVKEDGYNYEIIPEEVENPTIDDVYDHRMRVYAVLEAWTEDNDNPDPEEIEDMKEAVGDQQDYAVNKVGGEKKAAEILSQGLDRTEWNNALREYNEEKNAEFKRYCELTEDK